MKKLLLIVLIVLAILVACTRPIDELIVRKVNDKNAELEAITTVVDGTTTDKITDAQTTFQRLVLIINKSSKKMHLSENCSYAKKINDENKLVVDYSEVDNYLSGGYEFCSYCEKHF